MRAINLGREKKKHIIIPVSEPVPGGVELPDEPRRIGFEPDPEPTPEKVPA